MRRLLILLLLVPLAVVVAGCRDDRHVVTLPDSAAHTNHPCSPPQGSGSMGICETGTPSLAPLLAAAGGKHIVDVSSYQGSPDWASARRYVSGGIAKATENLSYRDPSFGYNWTHLRALGMWHAAYAFLRPGDCAAQARFFVAYVNQYGGFDSGPPIADAEVPMGSSCVSDFIRQAEALTHRVVVVYTGPGTWPGGSHGNAPLWVATYGSRPGCVWTCSHVAWQFSGDGLGPAPHSIPGVGGNVDISLDSGLLAMAPNRPTPPVPAPTNAQRAKLVRERTLLNHHLTAYGCRRRIRRHTPLGPRCRAWRTHLKSVEHRLAA